EFCGPVVRALATDERATLTNMTAELGGFTGIVAPDEETVRFLRERRGIAVEIEPGLRSDPGARYAGVIRVDCSALSPMVARRGDRGRDRSGSPARPPSRRARSPGASRRSRSFVPARPLESN